MTAPVYQLEQTSHRICLVTMQMPIRRKTYSLITTGLTNLLPHQLIDPLGLVAHRGVDTGYNKRHDEYMLKMKDCWDLKVLEKRVGNTWKEFEIRYVNVRRHLYMRRWLMT